MDRDNKGRFIAKIKDKLMDKKGCVTIPAQPQEPKKRGGYRLNAGRKKADVGKQERRKHSLYCTEMELITCRIFLDNLRSMANVKEISDAEEQVTARKKTVFDIYVAAGKKIQDDYRKAHPKI